MLAVTLIHVALLFVYGSPEWKPLLTSYLGLLLLGGCFISVGMFISTLTKNQVVSFMATFGMFLFLWVITWIGSCHPVDQGLVTYLSIIDHYEDFNKGRHRHDAPDLLHQLHHLRSLPDRQVGRHRTVARMKRCGG